MSSGLFVFSLGEVHNHCTSTRLIAAVELLCLCACVPELSPADRPQRTDNTDNPLS